VTETLHTDFTRKMKLKLLSEGGGDGVGGGDDVADNDVFI